MLTLMNPRPLYILDSFSRERSSNDRAMTERTIAAIPLLHARPKNIGACNVVSPSDVAAAPAVYTDDNPPT